MTYPRLILLASQIKFLRTTYGSRLNVFAPINDLSSLSKRSIEARGFEGVKDDVTLAGGQILGDEYSDHVVKVLYLHRSLSAREALTWACRTAAV